MGEGLSITARITIALAEVRAARTQSDLDREWAWSSMLDRLLSQHLVLLQANGRPSLSVLDPELDERLTVKPSIRLIGRAPMEVRNIPSS